MFSFCSIKKPWYYLVKNVLSYFTWIYQSFVYIMRMINNLTKGKNTMTNEFYNTMNKVDSQLYEIAKTLKSFDSSLNVEDLMNNILDTIETNVYNQITDLNFKKEQLNKDNNIVK